MNQDWHQQHPEPRHATLEQKLRWHVEHMKECACTPPPGAIMIELDRRERRGQKKKRFPRR